MNKIGKFRKHVCYLLGYCAQECPQIVATALAWWFQRTCLKRFCLYTPVLRKIHENVKKSIK